MAGTILSATDALRDWTGTAVRTGLEERLADLLDGAPVTVAAFLAERLSPGTRQWCQAGQLSPEPAHLIALQALELTPLIALDMNAGQGTGALAALPLVKAAAELLAD